MAIPIDGTTSAGLVMVSEKVLKEGAGAGVGSGVGGSR
jgi:hypothetical protein